MHGVSFQTLLVFLGLPFPSFASLLLLSVEVVEVVVVPPSSAVACKPYTTLDKFNLLDCSILCSS